MAITFDQTVPEIVITTGQVTVTAQDLLNAIRLFEDDFRMMSYSHIADAEGKIPIDVGAGLFSEIILTLLEGNEGPWTIRFEDEATQHTSITGGTFLATDSLGNKRVVTTNPALTINQSVSGTLVETGVSGLTAAESATHALITPIHTWLSDIEGGLSIQQVQRLILAAVQGILKEDPDNTIKMHGLDNSTVRLEVVTDADNNRNVVIRNPN